MRRLWLTFTLCAATAALAAGAAYGRAVPTTNVNVVAGKPSEFQFTLSKKSVKHGKVVFKIANKGNVLHDFKVCTKPARAELATTCNGRGSRKLGPGKSITLTVVFKAKGRYEYLCTVAGHAAAGMRGVLKVT
jgi:uncharacterized cupredoxin-like copper-binding protein